MRQLRPQDGQLLLQIGVFNVEIRAAAAQRLGEGPRTVGSQHHEGDGARADRAHLRDGHLHLGQQLQQEGLELLVRLVDLVDQQHHALLGAYGLEQRTLQQIFVAEEVAGQLVPALRARVDLDAEQLLLIVPLVERLALVQALVALQAHQLPTQRMGHHLGHLRLANARSALDQQRPPQLKRHGQHRGEGIVVNVVHLVHLCLELFQIHISAPFPIRIGECPKMRRQSNPDQVSCASPLPGGDHFVF